MSQLGVGAGWIGGELVSMEYVINSATCRYWPPNKRWRAGVLTWAAPQRHLHHIERGAWCRQSNCSLSCRRGTNVVGFPKLCAGRKEGVGRRGGRTCWARRSFSYRTVSFWKQKAQCDVGSTEQERDTPARLARYKRENEGRLVEGAGMKLAIEHSCRVTKGPGDRH